MCQGDLGDAVHALASGTGQHGRQTRLVQPPRLTVESLLRAFRAMAGSTGQVRHTCRHAQSVVVLRSPHPTHSVATPRCANPQGSAQHKLRGVVKLYQSALIKPSSSRARAPQLFASRASGAASGVRSKDDPAIEAQFLTRTLVRELRMGANLTLVLTALAHAVVWRPCDRRALSEASPVLLRSPPSAGVLAHAQRLLSQRFALCPDLRTLATAVVEGGLQAVTTACRVRVGGCMRGDVQWCGVYGDSFPVLCVPRHANEPYASCSGHGH